MLGYVVERHTYIGTATYTCSVRRFTETGKTIRRRMSVLPFELDTPGNNRDEDTSMLLLHGPRGTLPTREQEKHFLLCF